MAVTLRRYRAEWRAALARRDYQATRAILGAAVSAVSREAAGSLDTETRALHELLALERRLQAIADGDAPLRLPAAGHAFGVPSTARLRRPWDQAVQGDNRAVAFKVLRQAIAALSRRMAQRARAQQALIARLQRLQRAPLQLGLAPARCAFCGGTELPGIDSGRLFMCADCVQQAHDLLADTRPPKGPRRA
jgi:hypothetical protein